MLPMPTWKPAYRLVVGEKGEGVLVQGWSVVDNLSGEAWERVRLSLTAGTPLAFEYDLYTPRDIKRPDLSPTFSRTAEAPPPPRDATASPEKPASTPSTTESSPKKGYYGYRSRRWHKSRPRRAGSAALGGRYLPRSRYERSYDAKEEEKKPVRISMRDMERSYKTLVSGTSVGSLFRYDIGSRVTVPDRSSALVSIINRRVQGKDVLYYLMDSGRPTPYRAVQLKNTTGFVLERGPIAIYREGAFVGEALSGRIEKNATTFVPYALEGRVVIHQTSSGKDEGASLVKIINGYITVDTRQVAEHTYSVINRTGEAMTLYVSRPRRSGWTVVEPKNAIMEKSVYYAPIELKASGTTSFTVKEVTPVRRVYTIFSTRARNALALFLKGPAPAWLRKKIEEVMTIWQQISDLSSRMSTLRSSMNMLRNRQADIRENIKVLGTKANKDLRRKLLKSLAEVEKQLNGINRSWVELNMKRGSLGQRLSVMLRMIRYEPKKRP